MLHDGRDLTSFIFFPLFFSLGARARSAKEDVKEPGVWVQRLCFVSEGAVSACIVEQGRASASTPISAPPPSPSRRAHALSQNVRPLFYLFSGLLACFALCSFFPSPKCRQPTRPKAAPAGQWGLRPFPHTKNPQRNEMPMAVCHWGGGKREIHTKTSAQWPFFFFMVLPQPAQSTQRSTAKKKKGRVTRQAPRAGPARQTKKTQKRHIYSGCLCRTHYWPSVD